MNAPHNDLQRLLSAPILPTLLKLAAPNVLAMVMTVLVGIAETYYVGRLGTAPLAAMALVFPFAMLTQMMSAGAMGGGVSAAISRALGASDVDRAQTLLQHALVIGLAAGLIYSGIFLLWGPDFYALLGGQGAVLEEAVLYGQVLFSGAVWVWLLNTLASILRGTGNMRAPSMTLVATAVLQIALGGVLSLGAGPIPAMGMVGVALGHIVATLAGVVVFLWYLLSGQGRLRLPLQSFTLHKSLFADILKVGAVACLSPVQSVLAILIFTGMLAQLGTPALAGYGIGQRLEFLLIPIAFGIGVASVPMVGLAMGAGQVARARRVAWVAGGVSAFNLALIGAVVTLAPDLWARLFTQDETVLHFARQYLVTAGPAFPFFGLGLTLYFASQGAGQVIGPVLAGTVRLVLVAGAGYGLTQHQGTANSFYALVAVTMVLYGVVTAVAVKVTPWAGR
ncbi:MULTISPECIES: MATE family efflux transporter [unclassified Limnohabitans]|jgi:putative MATE family efflux protein|uniref:MATE family efflux transporter n=1 Tax=unclassified Limnohabitans TaxID=2626134 RepID=UPI000A4443A4|nr:MULTISPECIES: MATE family efflux transporter [unclassified Limnohabitans]PUE13480.1 MATE family efflux transporter [Limnohabitans sp. WS1]